VSGYNAGGFVLTESAGAVNIEVENLFTVRKPRYPRVPHGTIHGTIHGISRLVDLSGPSQ
jgi:hypothetical protein